MKDAELAASFAIAHARRARREGITADDLLLGCLQTVAQFGVVVLGPWTFDLEAMGIDWMSPVDKAAAKVAYTETAVEIFDRAARIAKVEDAGSIHVYHLLAAFANEEAGIMGELKRAHGITSAAWRAAVGRLAETTQGQPANSGTPATREYLSPEEAAEVLGIHVQTLRAYVRSGKLPARRLAGERAIRIRRADLETMLEPFIPQE